MAYALPALFSCTEIISIVHPVAWNSTLYSGKCPLWWPMEKQSKCHHATFCMWNILTGYPSHTVTFCWKFHSEITIKILIKWLQLFSLHDVCTHIYYQANWEHPPTFKKSLIEWKNPAKQTWWQWFLHTAEIKMLCFNG